MYINTLRFTKELVKWSILFMPGVLGAIVFLGTAIDKGDASTIPFFIVGEILSLALIYNYISTMFYLGWMRLLERCFKLDSDGSVTVEEAAKFLKTTPERVQKMRRYGEKKRILVNLVFDAEGNRFVLTDRYNPGARVADRPFVGMSCPGCGANLKLRAGLTGVCPYCDRSVTAPNITVG